MSLLHVLRCALLLPFGAHHDYLLVRGLGQSNTMPGIWAWSPLMTSPMLMSAMSSPLPTSSGLSPELEQDPKKYPSSLASLQEAKTQVSEWCPVTYIQIV